MQTRYILMLGQCLQQENVSQIPQVTIRQYPSQLGVIWKGGKGTKLLQLSVRLWGTKGLL